MATDNSVLFSIIPYKEHFILFDEVKSAYLFRRDSKTCLKTGEKSKSSITDLKILLEQASVKKHIIFHAFYELGQFINEDYSGDEDLGIWLEFKTYKKIYDLGEVKKTVRVDWLDVDFDSYQKSFIRGKEHLGRGDCYQYNLTRNIKGKLSGDSLDLLRRVWSKNKNRGAYGSFTCSSILKKTFFSNSPECLFQVSGNVIETMPIKGTIKDLGDDSVIERLLKSKKNESELNMITDLLLHDLNVLTNLEAYVCKKKALLKVPGLIHTYSSIKGPYKGESIYSILKALFPGGSITGAPKRRVKEIIKEVEPEKRGFYCGSTVIKSDKLLAASINIRSMVIDEQTKDVSYGAGGGITFVSDVNDEFNEMMAKKNSFSDLLL